MKRLVLAAMLCLVMSFALGKFGVAPPLPMPVQTETMRVTSRERNFAGSKSFHGRTQGVVTEMQPSWDFIRENPKIAADLANNFMPGELRDEWLRIIANEWTRDDPGKALAWARLNLAKT